MGEFDCNPLTTAIQILLFPKIVPPLQRKVSVQVGPTPFHLKTQCSSFITNLKWALKNVSALEISHWANLLPLQHVSPLNRMG